MKNNKKLTYVMAVLVIVVWGLIIYRIVDATGSADDVYPLVANSQAKAPYNDYAISKDTTRLLLNYRDPFGLEKEKDTLETPVKKIALLSVAQPARPAINWSFIRYSGFIKNPGSKKLIALMTINGKNVMLTEGETAEQVKLLKNLKDSVKVTYSGKTKFITMNSGNP